MYLNFFLDILRNVLNISTKFKKAQKLTQFFSDLYLPLKCCKSA